MSNMLRVSATNPCPVCGKYDWCLRSTDGNSAICARIESSRPMQRPGRDRAGFLHILSSTTYTQQQLVSTKQPSPRPLVNINWPKLAASFTSELTPARLKNLTTSLGVSAESLIRLNVGWSVWHRAFSFPMRTADGAIVGIRLRKPTGLKYCITGSRTALFVPEELANASTLCIAEGPTDCAALLDLGLVAIGRPNCSGGGSQILRLVRRLRCREVVIVADGDSPGQVGAKVLADGLSALTVELRIVTPPSGIKDVREWKGEGATACEILSSPAITFPHPAIRRAKRHAVQHRRRTNA